MKLTFMGAAGGNVTGSHYLLETGKSRIIIDMGMFQGLGADEKNPVELDYDKALIDAVLITHAHLDHCGRVPILVKNMETGKPSGFKASVYVTKPTEDLMELVLNDAAHLMESGGRGDGLTPLYSQVEVMKILSFVKTVNYESWEEISRDVEVKFLDAGHILGAASLQLQVKNDNGGKKTIVFSGDLGNEPSPIVGLIDEPREAEVVIMESTYGNRLHEKRGKEEALIAQLSQEVEKNRGTLLIPAFSLERTQELLQIYDILKKSGAVSNKLKVYLDTPMGMRATAIYEKYAEFFNDRMRQIFRHDDPFDFPGLVLVEHHDQSRRIDKDYEAKVIIAGSGMMSGGRIVHHASKWLGDKKTILLFTGFQAKGTRGRHIFDGDREMVIEGRLVDIKARIEKIETMSGHADQQQLIDWLKQIHGVKKVILTHGEDEARDALELRIKKEFGYEVIKPNLMEHLVI